MRKRVFLSSKKKKKKALALFPLRLGVSSAFSPATDCRRPSCDSRDRKEAQNYLHLSAHERVTTLSVARAPLSGNVRYKANLSQVANVPSNNFGKVGGGEESGKSMPSPVRGYSCSNQSLDEQIFNRHREKP